MIGRRLVLVSTVACALSAVPMGGANHVVTVVNNSFQNGTFTIQVGDTVTFQKAGETNSHNVRSNGFNTGCAFGPTCFRCGEGNGCQGQGATGNFTSDPFSFTLDFFTQAGTFPYHCEVHGFPGGGMSGTITVEDSAPPPPPPPPPTNDPGVIRFTFANYNRNEGGGNATIAVERVGGDDGAVGVSLATSNGTAVAGQDYGAVNTNIQWSDGESGINNVLVPILDDGIDEPNETVLLALSDVTGGATLGNPSSATLTIVDNDVAGGGVQLGFSSDAFNAGEAMGHAELTVARSGSTAGAISVEYDTADGSAMAGQDYTAMSGTLNWSAGDAANKTIQIPLLDDTDFEGGETFSVVLSQPTGGATVGAPSTATVTINDNEALPPCEDSQFAVCLLDRFLVEIHWERNNGQEGDARATKLTDSSASFEFFDPGNVEIVAKIKDGCGFPAGNPIRNFWIFVAGLTNVRVELTVIDTETGTTRRFYNALNQPFFTAAADSPDGKNNPQGAIQATTVGLGAFPTCDQ